MPLLGGRLSIRLDRGNLSVKQLRAMAGSKYRRRAQLILTHSINQIALILFSPLLSFLVIRLTSLELWGAFVQILIVVQLGAHIAGWGNKEYLLRSFSRSPATVSQEWRSSMLTRLPLLIPLWIVLALLYPANDWPFLAAWSLALFFYQSYDVLIVFRKRFPAAAILEFSSLLLVIGAVLLDRHSLTVSALIVIFAAINILKALAYSVLFRRDIFSGRRWGLTRLQQFRERFNPHYFSLALPFFLLTFSGMLRSRIDLYAVNIFLTPTDVAQYQVFINFMLYLQAAAGFMVQPFVKSVYRLDYASIRKISWRLALAGVLIIPPGLVTVRILLTQLYEIFLPPTMYLWGGLYVLPIFFYLPTIYALFKADQQTMVIKVNFAGVALGFSLNLLLLPRFGLLGAIVSAAVWSWIAFFIYLRSMRQLLK